MTVLKYNHNCCCSWMLHADRAKNGYNFLEQFQYSLTPVPWTCMVWEATAPALLHKVLIKIVKFKSWPLFQLRKKGEFCLPLLLISQQCFVQQKSNDSPQDGCHVRAGHWHEVVVISLLLLPDHGHVPTPLRRLGHPVGVRLEEETLRAEGVEPAEHVGSAEHGPATDLLSSGSTVAIRRRVVLLSKDDCHHYEHDLKSLASFQHLTQGLAKKLKGQKVKL